MLRNVLLLVFSLGCVNSLKPEDELGSDCKGVRVVRLDKSYVSDHLVPVGPLETVYFVASTCGSFDGFKVDCTVELPKNPTWDVNDGVIYYYITSKDPDQSINNKDILCSNEKKTNSGSRKAVPKCHIDNWKKADSLYVVARSGDVDAVQFTVTCQFRSPDSPHVYANYTFENFVDDKDTNYKKDGEVHEIPSIFNLPAGPKPPRKEYLTQCVMNQKVFELKYRCNMILQMSFCPNPETTMRYEVEDIILSDDVTTATTQYACHNLEGCGIDSPEVFASNPHQLPINSLAMYTYQGGIKQLFIMVRCWAGDKDPKTGHFVCHFRCGATLKSFGNPPPPLLTTSDGQPNYWAHRYLEPVMNAHSTKMEDLDAAMYKLQKAKPVNRSTKKIVLLDILKPKISNSIYYQKR